MNEKRGGRKERGGEEDNVPTGKGGGRMGE